MSLVVLTFKAERATIIVKVFRNAPKLWIADSFYSRYECKTVNEVIDSLKEEGVKFKSSQVRGYRQLINKLPIYDGSRL
jgi:hypothetical protein